MLTAFFAMNIETNICTCILILMCSLFQNLQVYEQIQDKGSKTQKDKLKEISL